MTHHDTSEKSEPLEFFEDMSKPTLRDTIGGDARQRLEQKPSNNTVTSAVPSAGRNPPQRVTAPGRLFLSVVELAYRYDAGKSTI